MARMRWRDGLAENECCLQSLQAGSPRLLAAVSGAGQCAAGGGVAARLLSADQHSRKRSFEVMRGKGMVALGRLVLSKRDRGIGPPGFSASRSAGS
jgi:hypothetical protein